MTRVASYCTESSYLCKTVRTHTTCFSKTCISVSTPWYDLHGWTVLKTQRRLPSTFKLLTLPIKFGCIRPSINTETTFITSLTFLMAMVNIWRLILQRWNHRGFSIVARLIEREWHLTPMNWFEHNGTASKNTGTWNRCSLMEPNNIAHSLFVELGSISNINEGWKEKKMPYTKKQRSAIEKIVLSQKHRSHFDFLSHFPRWFDALTRRSDIAQC